MRDSFRRAQKNAVTKSGQKSKLIKKWKFEDELQFLKTHLKERESMSNIDTVSDYDEDLFEAGNEICLPEKNTELDIDTSCNDTYFNNLSPNTSTPSPKEFRQPILKNTLATMAKKKSKVSNPSSETASSTLMKYILENKNEENLNEKKESSAIDQFLLSMCSTVKEFSPYHQHLAKTKIFSIVSEIELENLRTIQQQQLFNPRSQSISNFDVQPQVQAVAPQMPPGQSQHHLQSQINSLYPLQQRSENSQEGQNLTSSGTSYFQHFQADTDTI